MGMAINNKYVLTGAKSPRSRTFRLLKRHV